MGEEPASDGSWIAEARAAMKASWRERVRNIPSLKPRELIALGVLVVAIVGGAAFAFVRALPHASAAHEAPGTRPLAAPTLSASPSPGLIVYVAGAVAQPGVYDFPAGARVIDALKRAGGPDRDADLESMNLAAPLVDGSKLYVPRKGESPPPEGGGSSAGSSGASSSGGGKVNINTATAAELDSGLPGVGPVLAQRIVDYRTQHGPFRSVNDLMKVEGIGQKKFDSLKDFVTV